MKAGSLGEKAAAWKSAAEAVEFPRTKAFAAAQAKRWRTEFANYDGYAKLTVLSARGLPKAAPQPWSNGLPDPFVVVRQTGAEAFRTRVVKDAVAPGWGESGRVRWKPGMATAVEVRDSYLVGSKLLAEFKLEPGTPDGEVKLRSGGVEVRLEVRRER